MGVVSSKLSARREQRRRRLRRRTTCSICGCTCGGSSRASLSRDKSTAVPATSHTNTTNINTTTKDDDLTKPTVHHCEHASPPTSSSPSSVTLAKPTTSPSHHGTTTNINPQQRHHSSSTASSTSTTTDAMASRLSEGLKALINAPHASPGYTKASPLVAPALSHLAQSARSKNVGLPAWITLSTAVSATLNCPEAMTSIFHLANEQQQQSAATAPQRTAVQNAELIREVGLKCISFNGIPRTINTLGAFHASLPPTIQSQLKTIPKRQYTPSNLEARQSDGLALWDSVYRGFERKLIDKLATSHPDLPVHILASHYANLLSDPSATAALTGQKAVEAGVVEGAKVGRVLTSLVAIACLRAQTGVGPQVVSHVFGLRKAYGDRENCGAESAGEDSVEGGEWLASEEGNVWLLESVDRLVEAITAGSGKGTTFAPGFGGKAGSKL